MQPTGEIHPAADLFPMLGDEELADLAADIAANGLLYPIVLDADGRLIDGRNRLRACQMAGIEPQFTSLNGHDPVAYILSANIQRRHLSKGQAAMAAVQGCLVSKQDGSLRELAIAVGTKVDRLFRASTVSEYAPDLVNDVLSGILGLDAAYDEARQRKQARETETERSKRLTEELAALRAVAPNLADLVVAGTMTLAAAQAALKAQQEEERRQRQTVTRNFVQALLYLDPSAAGVASTAAATAAQLDATLARGMDPASRGDADLSPLRIRNAAAVLTAIAEQLEALHATR